MKKLRNLIIAFLLLFAFVPSVFATIAANSTGTIKLSGIKEKVTVTAYKLMNVTVAEYDDEKKNAPQDPVYTWTDEVAAWVEANYPAYINRSNFNAVTKEFNKDLTNTRALAAFYASLKSAITAETSPLVITNKETVTTEGDGNDEITDVSMGHYLILVTGGVYKYSPSSVNVVPVYDESKGWNVSEPNEVVVKFTNPQINKTTEDADKTVQIGDTVDYTITVDVPNYREEQEEEKVVVKTLAIKDTLSSGLTFNSTTLKVYGVKNGTRTELTINDDYTFVTEGISETFKVSFSTEQYESVFRKAGSAIELNYDQIVIEYSATVNANAINGTGANTNNAILEYNNPENETETATAPSVVTVYTYNIQITKTDGTKPLSGAKFSVKLGDDNKLSFVKLEDGVYRLAIAGDTATTDLLEVSAQGVLIVKGLDLGEYTITEEEAPAGYVKLQNPVQVTIADSDLNGTVEDETDNTVKTEIVNTQGFTLPVTGGIGTVIFSVVGILFMGISALLIRSLLKKREA